MSLLIKALQKAEQSKEGAATDKAGATGAIELELAPHHEEDAGYSLADESGFTEPVAPTRPSPAKAAPVTPPPTETPRPAAPPAPVATETERAAAANMFRARTEPMANPGSRRAFWLGLGGLVLLLGLGGGFYFYLDSLQQPQIVVARPIPIQPAASTATPAVVPEVTAIAPETSAPAAPTENAPEKIVDKPVAPAPITEKPATPSPSTAKPSPKVAAAEDSAVKVTRNRKSEPPTNATAIAAYQAFMAGDDATAGRLYRQLLQSEPRNTDALLGLAAVSARQENTDEAAGFYARALELEPKNSIAQAGLIALLGNADPVAAESRLKSLLAQQPDAAYLHAALGGIYSEQNQWPNAQQSYFQAYRLDSGNAEYAFNLAISLDQLSKPELALDYYQRARDLLPKQGGAVDRAALENRISQLRSMLAK